MSDGPWRVRTNGYGWFVETNDPSFSMSLALTQGADFKWEMQRYAQWLADRLNTFPPYDAAAVRADEQDAARYRCLRDTFTHDEIDRLIVHGSEEWDAIIDERK